MPSSPEPVTHPAPAPRWEPVVLGGASAAAGPAPVVPFERTADAVLAPQPFTVSDHVGVPPAVLAEARRAARSQGYAAGFASGMAGAREQAAAAAARRHDDAERDAAAARGSFDRVLSALGTATADLAARNTVDAQRVHQLVVDGAYELAEALVGSVLRDDERRGRAALERVLALTPVTDQVVTVALNPADHAVVDGQTVVASAGVRVVADPGVALGDAVARTGDTTVESRLHDALARVREVLGR